MPEKIKDKEMNDDEEQKKGLNTLKDNNNCDTRGRGEKSSPTQFIFSKRLMIFIDGENLFQFSKRYNIKFDYNKLVNFLSKDYDLIRVYYYIGIPTKQVWDKTKENFEKFENRLNKQLSFLDSLELKHNFEVIKKPLALSNEKIIQKGIDVKIASDIIWHGLSNNYDAFILISGDKDLMDCLIRMKDNGKQVIVANFEGKISRELKKIADKYINLSEYLEEIKLED